MASFTSKTGKQYRILDEQTVKEIFKDPWRTIPYDHLRTDEEFGGVHFNTPLSISLRNLKNPEAIEIEKANGRKLEIAFFPLITTKPLETDIEETKFPKGVSRSELIRTIYTETKLLFDIAREEETELTKKDAKKWFQKHHLGISTTPICNKKPGSIISLWNFGHLVLETIDLYKFHVNNGTIVEIVPNFGT